MDTLFSVGIVIATIIVLLHLAAQASADPTAASHVSLNKAYICKNCGFVGKRVTITPGSIWVELFLWLFFVTGVLYSTWRLANRYKGCPLCKARDSMIPVESPLGKELYNKITAKQVNE